MTPKYYFANLCTFVPFTALFLASETREFIVILHWALRIRCPAVLPGEGHVTEETGRIRFCTKRPSFLFILIGKYILEAGEVTGPGTCSGTGSGTGLTGLQGVRTQRHASPSVTRPGGARGWAPLAFSWLPRRRGRCWKTSKLQKT